MSGELSKYMQQVQRLIRDADQKYLNPQDLIEYINQSRRQIALRTQCVRALSPVSGQVVTATVTNGGSGYVTPVATISAPDFASGKGSDPNGLQATATVQQIGGVITSIDITNGGSGYYQPTITITDDSDIGVDATATVAISSVQQTAQGQEVYNFSDVVLGSPPGVGQVFWVNSVSFIYSQFRYMCMIYSFSTYQALIRNYPQAYQFVPSVGAQLGQGANGSFYLYPIASQPYQMEWDCFCEPTDLDDDQSTEAIPQPWQDTVQWYAAHLAFLELQNFNAANYYAGLVDKRISDFSSWARPRRVNNRYGRW